MRIDFRKSFARDLRNRKNDLSFLNHIKKTIEDIELTETISGIKNLKKLKEVPAAHSPAGCGQSQGAYFQKHAAAVRCHRTKVLPPPSFKVKQYGEIRVKNNSNTIENGCLQDYAINEFQTAYGAGYAHKNWSLRGENAVFWNDFHLITNT